MSLMHLGLINVLCIYVCMCVCMYVSWSDVSSAFNSPSSFFACLVVVPVAGRLLFLLMWGIYNNEFILASGKDGVLFVFENNKRITDHLIACHEE